MKRKPVLLKAIQQEKDILDNPRNIKKHSNKNQWQLHNKVIAVGNLSKRAGATFITLNLAKALSDMGITAGIIEPPLGEPYIFDAVGLNIRISSKLKDEFIEIPSYPHLIFEGQKNVKGLEIIDDNLIWMVTDPRRPTIKGWEYSHMIKLIHATNKATVSILDCGEYLQDESVKAVLDYADLILVIIDPLPTECMQNEDRLAWLYQLQQKGFPIHFIINRWNKGVNQKELINYLKIESHIKVPAIEPTFVYKAFYDCKIPMELPEVANLLNKPMASIIEEYIFPGYPKVGKYFRKEGKRKIGISRRRNR